MNKWIELLLGLILIIASIIFALIVWPSWWNAALQFLIGGVFWFLVGLGLLFILLGISDLKE